MAYDYEKDQELEKQILAVCPNAKHQSGIYIMTRKEYGFKYVYVGQSVDVLQRLVQHLKGYDQYIDKSIRKHHLKSVEYPNGWEIGCLYYKESELNAQEQYFIRLYANAGYQMRNMTSGSQDGDKFGINEYKDNRGYRQGVADGKKAVLKAINTLFEKYLDCGIKEPSNKVKERKLKEFEEMLKGEQENV